MLPIKPRRALASVLACLTLAGVACSDGSAGLSGTAGTEIHATLEDFLISLDPSSAPAGPAAFAATNDGPSAHQFIVARTDLAPGELPTTDQNGVEVVDEKGKGLRIVCEITNIPPSSSTSLAVHLDEGSYVVFCNLPGHYVQGMHAALTAT